MTRGERRSERLVVVWAENENARTGSIETQFVRERRRRFRERSRPPPCFVGAEFEGDSVVTDTQPQMRAVGENVTRARD